MWWEIVLPIVLVMIVVIIASIITYAGINSWYKYQARAPGQPPNWAFVLVWLVLYVAFTYAWNRALLYAPDDETKAYINLLFILSIWLNLLWVICFFWLHNAYWGVLILVAMIILGFLLLVSLGYDLLAAYLLGIYELWLIFALMLNSFYYNQA